MRSSIYFGVGAAIVGMTVSVVFVMAYSLTMSSGVPFVVTVPVSVVDV